MIFIVSQIVAKRQAVTYFHLAHAVSPITQCEYILAPDKPHIDKLVHLFKILKKVIEGVDVNYALQS